MSSPVVVVSPLPAHFLLRRPIEQAFIVTIAGIFAFPGLLVFAAHVWAMGFSFGAITGALFAFVPGWIGWKLGTGIANILALVRIRREQKAGGQQ